MHPTDHFSNLQTFFTVAPLLLLLIAGISTLDAAAASRKTARPARSFVPVHPAGLPAVMTNPDVRPWDQN